MADKAIRPVVHALVSSGNTWTRCSASLTERLPPPSLARGEQLHRHPGRRPLHGQGIPHLERHRADGPGAGQLGAGGHRAEAQERRRRRRPRGGGAGWATPRPWRGAPTSTPVDQPVRGRRAAGHHPRRPPRCPPRPKPKWPSPRCSAPAPPSSAAPLPHRRRSSLRAGGQAGIPAADLAGVLEGGPGELQRHRPRVRGSPDVVPVQDVLPQGGVPARGGRRTGRLRRNPAGTGAHRRRTPPWGSGHRRATSRPRPPERPSHCA